jgi:predicted nucleic acid-binding Zn ribbon protein
MPVYVYRNLATNETFELEQRISEPALTVHPETGDPVKRLVQPVGIAFKGSGFYVTDSRKSDKRSGGESKSEAGDAKGSSACSTPCCANASSAAA